MLSPLVLLWLLLTPVVGQAQWDTVPPLRSEELLKIQQEVSEEEDEELAALEEKAKEYGAVERYLAAEGGYYTLDFSFATAGQGEYQAFLFGQVERYGVLVRLDYLNQFGSEAFSFEVGGHYHISPTMRTGLMIRFAPGDVLIEQQGYRPFLEVGLLNRKLLAKLTYQFRDFKQAHLHDGELALDLRVRDLLTISPVYRLNITSPSVGTRKTNHLARVTIAANIIPEVSLRVHYSYLQQSFEAGALTPFDSFRAQEIGGGLSLHLSVGASLYFDMIHQDRNNGQSFQLYNVGTYFKF